MLRRSSSELRLLVGRWGCGAGRPVKLDIDEKGAKVENIGVIAATKGKISRPANIKEIILNKPFWVVMRESESAPYFVSYIKVPVEK